MASCKLVRALPHLLFGSLNRSDTRVNLVSMASPTPSGPRSAVGFFGSIIVTAQSHNDAKITSHSKRQRLEHDDAHDKQPVSRSRCGPIDAVALGPTGPLGTYWYEIWLWCSAVRRMHGAR